MQKSQMMIMFRFIRNWIRSKNVLNIRLQKKQWNFWKKIETSLGALQHRLLDPIFQIQTLSHFISCMIRWIYPCQRVCMILFRINHGIRAENGGQALIQNILMSMNGKKLFALIMAQSV